MTDPTNPTNLTNQTDPNDLTDQLNIKKNIQNKMLSNDLNDLNMFVSYRGALFKGSILSSLCATIGLSTLTFINIVPNIAPSFAISNRVKLFPIGIFIVSSGLNLLFNQLDSKLEVQQKKLLNKYNINIDTYVDQNALNDIPTPNIPSFNRSNPNPNPNPNPNQSN